MAKNRANCDAGGDNPSTFRTDINDILIDLGYAATGDVSSVTIAGAPNKLVKTTATGGAVLTGGLTANGASLIKKTAPNALDVQNDGGTSVFKVDTSTSKITMAGIIKYKKTFISLSGTPESTGISINGGSGGKTIILSYSAFNGAGDNTNSTITMIRCGYDGDNFSDTTIATSGVSEISPIYSQVGGVLYIATSSGGTATACLSVEENNN